MLFDRDQARTVYGNSTLIAIAAGGEHACGVKTDGGVECWGSNLNGQLGRGTTGSQYYTPQLISGLTLSTTTPGLALGVNHGCAKLTNGTLKCWGDNAYGQIGDGTTTLRNSPVAVSGVTTVSEVAAGTNFTCSKHTSGAIKCWGSNDSGQMGLVSAGTEPSPAIISPESLNKILDIAHGDNHTCVVWDAGEVRCWGANESGQLGNGTTTASESPITVSGITAATAVTAGKAHTCALLSNGTVKCWGAGANGQLGDNSGWTNELTPVTVYNLSTVTHVAAGAFHTCARLTNSTLKCWGENGHGELGNNDWFHADRNDPASVSNLNTAVGIWAGGGDVTGKACAVLNVSGVGKLACWGKADYNDADWILPLISIASGVDYTNPSVSISQDTICAKMSDATVKCFGLNAYGEVGNGTTGEVDWQQAATVSNLTSVASLTKAGRSNHHCAVRSDKTVQCWGRNNRMQLGNVSQTDSSVPVTASGVTRAVKVAAGLDFTCARLDDSTMQCWGENDNDQIRPHQSSYTTASSLPCQVTSVERSDYFVSFTTANMPDSAFNGLAAQLDTHRVKPRFFPESCTAQKAAVLVHGRTVEGVTAFDLQYQDYSFMEQLALTGIDAFTFNHLGMGRSRIPTADAFANSCNASLPSCLDTGSTCPPPPGVLCDCGPVATFGANDKNQQGSTRYLNPNPRTSLCAHTTNTRFTNTTTMVNELDVEVTDALAKTGLSKVSVLGYSAGGVDVGNYLGASDDTIRAARTAKIDKAIFVASLFGLPQIGATEPTGGSNAHSYPMGVLDRTSATNGGFNLDLVACPGQRDDNIVGPIWESFKARDTVGAGWGPAQTPSANSGLSRFPQATRWGWNATTAARITVPVLVMHGLRDNVVPVVASANLYAGLTGTSSKTIVQIGCASHSIFWEGCSGASCNSWTGPHATILKNSKDWIHTGLIYASPGSPNGSFESTANDGTNTHTTTPSSTGPTANESNQTP